MRPDERTTGGGATDGEPAGDAADLVVVDAAGRTTTATWAAVEGGTDRVAAALDRAGAGPAAPVVLVGDTCRELVLALRGAWRCGAAVSLVPGGGRRAPAAVAASALARVRALDAAVVVAERTILDELARGDGPAAPTGLTPGDVAVAATAGAGRHAGSAAPGRPRAEAGPDGTVAFYQATSGTTGAPRLVPVTWAMLRANLDGLAERLDLDGTDRFVSWMPLHHDMGLVTSLALPIGLGAHLALMAPEAFARSPGAFLRLVERCGGTVSGAPTTGVALLARALESDGPFDLSSLRAVICGAEMIDVALCDRAVTAGRRHGLRPDVFAFGYGMAEATLAVTLRRPAPPDNGEEPADALRPVTETPATTADGAAERGGDPDGDTPPPGVHWLRPAAGRGLARTGRPLLGCEVRIGGTGAGAVPGTGVGDVGEIEVRGPSVMASYLGRSAADSSVGPDGWFRTGDLGYLVDGELVVVGRAKDIVVVGGRNVVPDDVERAVGALAGIRPGRVAAVPVAGRAGEALGVVAERTDDAAGAAVDAAAVRAAVQRALALAPEVVTFVARGAIPKTTSGKLRRQACRGLLAGPERASPRRS